MTHTRRNEGTCSSSTTVELAADGSILRVEVEDGCDGNLKAVCALLQGRDARQAAALLRNLHCEGKPNSCPRQIALCLEAAAEKAEISL